jgi:hypothetical protein
MLATSVVNQGPFSTVWGQVIAGVVVVLLTTGVGMLIKVIRSLIDKVESGIHKTDSVYDAVAGREPSPLEPSPPPGLTTISMGHTQAILDTAAQVKKMADHQLAQNGKVGDIQKIVKRLEDAGKARDENTTHRQLEVLSAIAEEK